MKTIDIIRGLLANDPEAQAAGEKMLSFMEELERRQRVDERVRDAVYYVFLGYSAALEAEDDPDDLAEHMMQHFDWRLVEGKAQIIRRGEQQPLRLQGSFFGAEAKLFPLLERIVMQEWLHEHPAGQP